MAVALHPQAHLEMESGTKARLALYPNAPAHQFHQMPRDGQAQPGATVLAGGGAIGLAEGLKQARALLGVHADPGVAHPEMQLRLLSCRAPVLYAEHDLALLGELRRIVAQVDQHLAKAQRVADQGGRQLGIGVEQQFQAFVLGFEADHAGKAVEHGLEVEGNVLQVHLAGLDPGEVEDVVDDHQQVFRRAMDLFDVVALAVVELGSQCQVAHADDGVHRCADLVAHGGQEVALGPGRLFCGLPCALHLGLGGLAVGDVKVPVGPHAPLPQRHRDGRNQYVEALASSALQGGLEVQHCTLRCRFEKALVCLRVDPELRRIRTFEFSQTSPEQTVELRIAVGRTAIDVPDHHGHRAAVEYCAQLCLAGLECRLQMTPFAHVAHRSAHAYAVPFQARQMRQADLCREQTSVFAHALQVVQVGPHLASGAVGHEALAQRLVAPSAGQRHQTIDGLAEQLTGAIAEQLIQLAIGAQDLSLGIDHQHAVRRRFDNPAIPGLGGAQRRLLGFQCLRLLLQLQRLFRHFIGLATGFRQQGLDRLIALQNRHGCGQTWGGLLQQQQFTLAQGLQPGQFEHPQQPLATDNGLQQQATGRDLAKGRAQTPILLRHRLKLTRHAIHRALAQQAVAEHDLRLGWPLGIGGITPHQQQRAGILLRAVQHPLADSVQAGHALQEHLRQFGRGFCLLQIDLQLGGMRLDPALALKLLGFGLQFGDGPRQIAGFVVQVGVGNRLIELPRGQLVYRHPHPVQWIADRLADDPGQQQRQRQTTEQQYVGQPGAVFGKLGNVLGRVANRGFLDLDDRVQKAVGLPGKLLEFTAIEQHQRLVLLALVDR
ncbi:hypothetical protein D3C72_575360 [compost metagenome]